MVDSMADELTEAQLDDLEWARDFMARYERQQLKYLRDTFGKDL